MWVYLWVHAGFWSCWKSFATLCIGGVTFIEGAGTRDPCIGAVPFLSRLSCGAVIVGSALLSIFGYAAVSNHLTGASLSIQMCVKLGNV